MSNRKIHLSGPTISPNTYAGQFAGKYIAAALLSGDTLAKTPPLTISVDIISVSSAPLPLNVDALINPSACMNPVEVIELLKKSLLFLNGSGISVMALLIH